MSRPRILLVGCFSLPRARVTAGDVLVRDVLCRWLVEAGLDFHVALHDLPALACELGVAVSLADVSPEEYTHVVYVCGPFFQGPRLMAFLERFRGCRLLGINLSMLEPVSSWQPFDLLVERDSDRTTRPDLAFLAPTQSPPLVGLILVHPQREYGARGRQREVERVIRRVLLRSGVAVIPVDTELETNQFGLQDTRAIDAVISRLDAVVTTRLHGTVLALRHGVPPVVVDAISGGAKVAAQARAVGWSRVFLADSLCEKELEEALAWALTPAAREEAAACSRAARETAGAVRDQIVTILTQNEGWEQRVCSAPRAKDPRSRGLLLFLRRLGKRVRRSLKQVLLRWIAGW